MKAKERIAKIAEEFKMGFEFISKLEKTVGIFGSTRLPETDHYYKEAESLAKMLSEAGYTVITGGGPGIMEAANKGALKGGGDSVGLNIKLREWQKVNKFVKKSIGFDYFFIRKVMFSFSAPVYIFFPGGYGTLDEFFEMIMLAQTKEVHHPVLIINVGKEYWSPLFSWLRTEVFENKKAVSKEDLEIFHLVDSAKEAFELIKSRGE